MYVCGRHGTCKISRARKNTTESRHMHEHLCVNRCTTEHKVRVCVGTEVQNAIQVLHQWYARVKPMKCPRPSMGRGLHKENSIAFQPNFTVPYKTHKTAPMQLLLSPTCRDEPRQAGDHNPPHRCPPPPQPNHPRIHWKTTPQAYKHQVDRKIGKRLLTEQPVQSQRTSLRTRQGGM